jgi:UDP-N-acetylmuramate dehydrogenase
LDQLPDNAIPIGGGSNILINPAIKSPLVKVSSKFCPMTFENNTITCSAGTPLALFLKFALAHNQSGFEFATGVPATIGGMVYMNFECWGIEVSSFVSEVLIFDQKHGQRWIKRSEYKTAYRWTSFHNEDVILLAVKLKLKPAHSDQIKSDMNRYLEERKQKQPILFHTFGSVFKNPLPDKAGQLIDNLSLKGHSVGDARISDIHANFFENTNEASFEDTCQLIKLIQNKVSKMYNINLECEVQLIN